MRRRNGVGQGEGLSRCSTAIRPMKRTAWTRVSRPWTLPPDEDLLRLAYSARPDLAALRLGLDRPMSELIALRQRVIGEKYSRRAQGQPGLAADSPERTALARAEINAKQAQMQHASAGI